MCIRFVPVFQTSLFPLPEGGKALASNTRVLRAFEARKRLSIDRQGGTALAYIRLARAKLE